MASSALMLTLLLSTLSSAAPTSTATCSSSPTPSPACTIPLSAPSLAPASISIIDSTDGSPVPAPNRNATISTQRSTVFDFSIPSRFAGSDVSLCALQFRFPYIDDLPAGYPPFRWSGLEQMVLGRSGMRFTPRDGEGAEGWTPTNETGAVQPTPPGNVTVGTFTCGGGSNGDEPVRAAWLGESFNGWSLEFLQAGGSSGFSDGVGLFVVRCS